jgi:hypothetical protein
MNALHIILCILAIFTALGLACAVIVCRPAISGRNACRPDAGARRFVPSGPAGARAAGDRNA